MFLAVCATKFEMQALTDLAINTQGNWIVLVTGVGMVESALSLSQFLGQQQKANGISAVLNFGVAGAYRRDNQENAGLLEICLAQREFLGDFGICYPDRIDPLAECLLHRSSYELDAQLLDQANTLLSRKKLSVMRGNFVTVCGVSGTKNRGDILCSQYDGLCENMEGAAIARVCEAFNLPLLEMRTISNFVEDRDLSRWKLQEACKQAGKVAAILLTGLTEK